MPNQMIALQARNPQVVDPSRQNAQFANMMNMVRQSEAAQRQASLAQQAMDIDAAEEARAVRLAEPQFAKAGFEADTARIKMLSDFSKFSVEGLRQAQSVEDAVKIGDFIKSKFNDLGLQASVDQTIAKLTADPANFEAARQQLMFQAMENDKQLDQTIADLTTGAETYQVASPKYAGAPGGMKAIEIPGTRVQAPQGITYVKGDDGSIYPMPSKTSDGFAASAPSAGTPGALKPVAKALQTNPGALKDGPFAQSQPGYTGKSGGFATFDTPQAGIAAQENLLRGSYVNKGFNTINKIVNKYAPQGPENSAASVIGYKEYVARRVGVDINAPITAAQIPAVAQAMREYETDKKVGGRGAAGAPVAIIPGKPKQAPLTPEAKLARDTAVQNLYNAVQDAQKKGHLVSEKQSYVANRATELRQGRPYAPGGTAQKTSIDNIDAAATQLLRQFIQKGTSGTLNTRVEQENFLKSVGGGNATYETRLQTIRNFAKQNGITLNEGGATTSKAQTSKTTTPVTKPPAGVSAAEWKEMTPAERKLWQ